MKKILVLLLLLQFVIINLCYSAQVNPEAGNYNENIAAQNIEPFKDFLNRFIKAFNEKNTEEINKCIYPESGLFVLDNPGAFCIVEHFNSFDEIMNLEGEYNIGYLKALQVNCKFKKGKIPHYNCDDGPEGWNKEGCFYDDNQTLSITGYYKTMLEYGLGDTNTIEDDMKLAEDSEKYISHLAYSTEGIIGFYFGIINDNWYLICVDKITPCSA